MSEVIEGEDRRQVALLPEPVDDYVAEDSAVRDRRVHQMI
jgi:hypothetical protein